MSRDRLPLAEAKRRFPPPIWTIYASPRDYPGEYVARVWYGETPEPGEPLRAPDLVQIRELVVEAGASMPIMRGLTDDPCIVETWL